MLITLSFGLRPPMPASLALRGPKIGCIALAINSTIRWSEFRGAGRVSIISSIPPWSRRPTHNCVRNAFFGERVKTERPDPATATYAFDLCSIE